MKAPRIRTKNLIRCAIILLLDTIIPHGRLLNLLVSFLKHHFLRGSGHLWSGKLFAPESTAFQIITYWLVLQIMAIIFSSKISGEPVPETHVYTTQNYYTGQPLLTMALVHTNFMHPRVCHFLGRSYRRTLQPILWHYCRYYWCKCCARRRSRSAAIRESAHCRSIRFYHGIIRFNW